MRDKHTPEDERQSAEIYKDSLLQEASVTVSGEPRDYDSRDLQVLIDEANRDVRIAEDIYNARRYMKAIYQRAEELKQGLGA